MWPLSFYPNSLIAGLSPHGHRKSVDVTVHAEHGGWAMGEGFPETPSSQQPLDCENAVSWGADPAGFVSRRNGF